jgi:hypothetical protein
MIGTSGTGRYDICVPPPLGGSACAPNPPIFHTVNHNVQSKDTLNIIADTLFPAVGTSLWKDFLRPGATKVFVPVTDDDRTERAESASRSIRIPTRSNGWNCTQARLRLLRSSAPQPSAETTCSIRPRTTARKPALAKLRRVVSHLSPRFAPSSTNCQTSARRVRSAIHPSGGKAPIRQGQCHLYPEQEQQPGPVPQDPSRACEEEPTAGNTAPIAPA